MSILEANELSWVDEQIKAIKPPRKGATNYDISKVRTPFVFLYKKKKPKSDVSKKSIKKNSVSSSKGVKIQKNTLSKTSSVRLSLSAIINGSALINGRWYKLEDKVYGYTVAGIKLTSVLLVNGDKKLILSTTDTKRNLKFK
jgi:hypothetical protein